MRAVNGPQERLKSLRAEQQKTAEAKRAEAERAAQAARARDREMREIEIEIQAFQATFQARNQGRKPSKVDLQKPQYARQRVLVERYHSLKHGRAPPGLQAARARSGARA